MSGAMKSVLITLPKSLAKGPSAALPGEIVRSTPKLNFATSILADRIKMEDAKEPNNSEEFPADASFYKPDVCLRGKKRRLDHLTWEEKLQRKKLKNRVAAQTSRDRKKARLDELEESVQILKERNESLSQEILMLRSQNEALVAEAKLQRRERSTKGAERLCLMCQGRVNCAAPLPGSAVSPHNPPQQGGVAQKAPFLTPTRATAILLRILTIYLLSKSCSANSKETTTWSDSRSSLRAFCEKLPRKWKEILIGRTNKALARTIASRNVSIRQEWWGRHQKMWKPVEPINA